MEVARVGEKDFGIVSNEFNLHFYLGTTVQQLDKAPGIG
jgi:hypothetical protein